MLSLLRQILLALQEQNLLLRDLHLKLTGHQALAPQRIAGEKPSRNSVVPRVWQRTSQSLNQAEARANAVREALATTGSLTLPKPEG